MEDQVLSKLAELKIHIDQRLDEIFAICKSSGGAKVADLLPSASKRSAGFVPLANFGDENILVDLSPTKPDPVQPKQSPANDLEAVLNLPIIRPESNSLLYTSVDLGRPIDVNLSYVYSTRSFFVHLNYDEVENFYVNFNEYYSTVMLDTDIRLNPSNIAIKQLCCVLNDDDSSYYRAQILKATDGGFLVRFVDFGDIKMVQHKSIFKLFPDYARIPIFGLHCYLEGTWTTDFAKMETAFMDFLTMPNSYCTEIKANFQPSQSSNKMPVSLQVKLSDGSWKDLKDCNFDRVQVAECVSKLIFNFKDFAKNFLTMENFCKSHEVYGKLSSLADNRLSNASTYSGICTNATNASNFIFSQSLATEFTTNLSFFYRGLVENVCTSVKVNSLVVFGIQNKFFFRGFVLSVDSQKQYELFSVDFGFIISVKADEIFPLFEDFSLGKFPCFSALCALDNIVPIMDNKWSPVAVKTFQTLVQGTFTVHPKRFSNGNHSVEVEMANKNRAADMLKKFKLGKDEIF